MSRKMLINAQRAAQLRVAIVDGTTLENYQVDIAESGLTRGNIYRGVVANVQPSLNAAFVDIGEERDGFLSFDDVLSSAYQRQPPQGDKRPRIDQVLERGKSLLVQVTKDSAGQKGPVLTTNLSLAGRYLVLMPFDDVRGVSRKVDDDEARRKLKERLARLDLPEGQGVIVRTNGLDQNQTTLNRDLSALARLWKQVKAEAARGKGARLLYTDQDLMLQVLRDYLDNSIEQVVVDTDEAFETARSYMQAFMPRAKTKLVRYAERLPLYTRYHLEPQIDRIYARSVPLAGGGSVVIDNTEALTAIDVNSGRASKTGDHEETIFQVNREAAQEVARQLRLRDIGGLVVVDFIDMRFAKHRRQIEKEMRDAMKDDRARSAVGRISPNGLLEINRQRIKQALQLRTHRPCPTCDGVGRIASKEFAALGLLRRIEARAAAGTIRSVTVGLHPELADAVQNEHRQELAALERELDIKIEIVAAPNLHRTEERIEWGERQGGAAAAESKARPALSAKDLALPAAQRPRERGRPAPPEAVAAEGKGSAAEERPRRKRRRRRSGAKPTPEPTEGTRDEPSAAPPATMGDRAPQRRAEPNRERRSGDGGPEAPERPPRRRGGRRRRRGGAAHHERAATPVLQPGSPDRPERNELPLRPPPAAPPPPTPSATPPPPVAGGAPGAREPLNKPDRRWWRWGR